MSKIDITKQDRITIRIASPEVIMSWSKGPSQKSGNFELPHFEARKGRAFLREDFRAHARLGM